MPLPTTATLRPSIIPNSVPEGTMYQPALPGERWQTRAVAKTLVGKRSLHHRHASQLQDRTYCFM
jgi:hypothetical protein